MRKSLVASLAQESIITVPQMVQLLITYSGVARIILMNSLATSPLFLTAKTIRGLFNKSPTMTRRLVLHRQRVTTNFTTILTFMRPQLSLKVAMILTIMILRRYPSTNTKFQNALTRHSSITLTVCARTAITQRVGPRRLLTALIARDLSMLKASVRTAT